MRSATQYKEILDDLLQAIGAYKSECENPVPCHVMKHVSRDEIFKHYNELKKLGK